MTPTALKQALPEFASVSDPTVQIWLDNCKAELNPDFWASKYDLAHMYLTAHTMVRMGVLSGGAASAQPVGALQSVTVGPTSKTFAVATPTAGDAQELALTPYGLMYLRLAKSRGRLPMVM